jgi:hypothetical protein
MRIRLTERMSRWGQVLRPRGPEGAVRTG